MKNRKTKFFTCPLCRYPFIGKVDITLDGNLQYHFPKTYGKDLLVCDSCLAIALEAMKSNNQIGSA